MALCTDQRAFSSQCNHPRHHNHPHYHIRRHSRYPRQDTYLIFLIFRCPRLDIFLTFVFLWTLLDVQSLLHRSSSLHLACIFLHSLHLLLTHRHRPNLRRQGLHLLLKSFNREDQEEDVFFALQLDVFSDQSLCRVCLQ